MEGKRSSSASNSSSSSCEIVKKQKRQISIATFNKWQSLYNREHDSLVWLRCDKDREDRTIVSTLWCDVCKKYESSITGLKNFSRVWIDGSLNHRVSNVLDHATSIQHKAAMVRFNKDVGKCGSSSAVSNSLLARSMLRIDPNTRARLSKKFDVCYLLAKEGLPFKKYPKNLELESRHEVDVGLAYRSDTSAQAFVHYMLKVKGTLFYGVFPRNASLVS